jgi:hypothetical protein
MILKNETTHPTHEIFWVLVVNTGVYWFSPLNSASLDIDLLNMFFSSKHTLSTSV